MHADLIRSYVDRRWDLLSEEKVRARVARYRQGGAEACFQVAEELRARFLRLHPGGSSLASRQEDLAHHIELATKLERIADGLARR